jgi:predicted alpha/beta hydrolase
MDSSTIITCRDGVAIKGRWFRASGDSAATVVIAPGAAAEARFYHPFCEFLAERGIDVLSFDFRSIGESDVSPKQKLATGFTTWIEHDFPAVIDHARRHAQGRPLIVVGHSAGGWMAGVQPAIADIDALVGVAALSAHWRFMARPHRYAHWLAWHALVPTSCKLFGTWPGLIGFRKNLAPRFGIEFSRWARHRDFVFCEVDFAHNANRFRGHMHLFQIEDDPWGTHAAVSAFGSKFRNASAVVVESIRRHDSLEAPIGHFGMFRKTHSATLWNRILNAIRSSTDTRACAKHVPERSSGSPPTK